MKIKFDVTPTEFIIIKDILKKYLTKDCKAYVFGSRAKSSSLHGSDLDLALECKEKIDFKKLSKIKIDFEDSRLPYMVDVIDLQATKEYFKNMIEKEMIEFPLGKLEREPELRFKEFSGEWKEKKLGDIATFSKGKGISKSDISSNGKLECIRYGELYTIYNEIIKQIKSKTNLNKNDLVLSKYNDVIIPASGEAQIDIATASCVLKDEVALSGDLNIIRTKENGIFLAYYLNNTKKVDIAKLSQGISVVHLYSSQLKLLKLNLPQKQEQQKIASFLTTIDKKIEQLTKKVELQEQYKKGVMQKIFNQEIRFKKDDGSEFEEWEIKKIGELITERIEYPTTEVPIYSLTISDGIIPKSARYERSFLVNNGYEYKIIKYNDFAFNPMNLRFGALAKHKENIDAMVSKYYNIFYCNNNLNPTFAEEYFTNYNSIQFYNKMATGSLEEKKRVHFKEFIKFRFKFPCIKEQTKIANFLSSLDKKINSTKEQLAKIKEFKKGLLQNMFV